MWFQPEIPNPGVDLSKLQGSYKDDIEFPFEVKEKMIEGFYDDRLLEKISDNFITESLREDRIFNNLLYEDQYKVKHYPMRFMSQITSPDTLNLDYIDFSNEDNMRDELVTLSEIAHFVRCIPYYKLKDDFNTW